MSNETAKRNDQPASERSCPDPAGSTCECGGTGIITSDPKGKAFSDEWQKCDCRSREAKKYETESTQFEHRTVNMPAATYNRILNILDNLQKENTGIKGFFRRWKISHEPLRADARSVFDELEWMDSRKKLIRATRTYELHSSRPKKVRAGNG
jgi:hypothetical protein